MKKALKNLVLILMTIVTFTVGCGVFMIAVEQFFPNLGLFATCVAYFFAGGFGLAAVVKAFQAVDRLSN